MWIDIRAREDIFLDFQSERYFDRAISAKVQLWIVIKLQYDAGNHSIIIQIFPVFRSVGLCVWGGGGSHLYFVCTIVSFMVCGAPFVNISILWSALSTLLRYKQNYILSYSAGCSGVSQNCTENQVEILLFYWRLASLHTYVRVMMIIVSNHIYF